METEKIEQILEELGGDVSYADMFIEAAKQGAQESGNTLSPELIDCFYKGVEQHRKRWQQRANNKIIY